MTANMRCLVVLLLFFYLDAALIEDYQFDPFSTRPHPRQAAAAGTSENALYIFGGFTFEHGDAENVMKYSFSTNSWSNLNINFTQSKHCSVQYNGSVVLIGGYKPGFLASEFSTQDDKFTRTWAGPSLTFPSHISCALYPKNQTAFIFGGETNANTCTDHLYSLDLVYDNSTAQLVTINGTNKPLPRSSAASLFYKDTFYVFGGECGGARPLDDFVWKFHVENNTWSSEKADSIPYLYLHSAHLIEGTSKVALFGGAYLSNGTQAVNRDLFIYDLENSEWVTIVAPTDPKAEWPNATIGMTSAYVNRRALYFGGYAGDQNTDPESFWQLVPQFTCTVYNSSCGRCILTPNCGYCVDGNQTVCVAGGDQPYINGTCKPTQFNTNQTSACENNYQPPTWFVPVSIAVLAIIFVGIVATSVVDYRNGKTTKEFSRL
eukprot:TRINITY_DN8142_c0_g1_i1.p1 TRINITY_DN8142_c0_g1~~TRINITY_DN8142_c0_g1_i1.p1  ORF type:complete len:441 (+),score=67.52 TRINITY_DN8142_c0_g1_i1:27-1325(+)